MRARLSLVAILVLGLTKSASAVDITACGQSVADLDTGVLQADLDCSSEGGDCAFLDYDDEEVACSGDLDCPLPFDFCARAAVRLGAGSALQLNGHTLTGAGVLCSDGGTCSVSGPGTIVSAPVGILTGKKVVASGLTADGGIYGILTRRGGAILTDVTLSNNVRDGIWSWRGTIRGSGVVATGNGGEGVYAKLRPVILKDATASNNGGSGVDGSPPRGINVTAQGNGGAGMISPKGASVVDSTITGNAGGQGTIDIQCARRPRFANTICGRSLNTGPNGGGSWGICALD